MTIVWGFGTSMLPTMKIWGILSYKKQDVYHVGEIVVVKANDDKIYSHRIISINDDKIIIKGDNRDKCEPYEIDIPIQNIEGKVMWWWPK